jgi:hypothetical protein
VERLSFQVILAENGHSSGSAPTVMQVDFHTMQDCILPYLFLRGIRGRKYSCLYSLKSTGTIMEGTNTFKQQSNEGCSDTHKRAFAQWQQSYQTYQQLMFEFRQHQDDFQQQMAMWRERHTSFKDMREDLKREVREMRQRQYRRGWESLP